MKIKLKTQQYYNKLKTIDLQHMTHLNKFGVRFNTAQIAIQC